MQLGQSARQIRRVPLTSGQAQAQRAFANQQRVTDYPYYSRIKFFANRVPSGNEEAGFFYDIAQGTEARAFSYAVRETKVAAGFTTADGLATVADTNLSVANQTISGQAVAIHGLAIQLMPASMHLADGQTLPHRVRQQSYQLIGALYEALSVEIGLNGDENTFRLGTVGLIPGAGGASGGAPQLLDRTGIAGEAESQLYANNGWPTRGNFYKFPTGLVWKPQGNEDSMLNVIFRVSRTIRLVSGGSPENEHGNVAAANDPAGVATGVSEYTFPTELVFEACVHLISTVIAPRTQVA